MMSILVTILIIFLILCFIFFPFALIKVAKSKPTICPNCENKVKLVTDTAKCPRCRTKLYKHADGNYRIRA